VFGIDVGATSIHVALCDFAAVPVARREEVADIRQGPDVVLAQVKALTAELLEMHGIRPTQILGIGMGLPGPIEFSAARPAAPPLMPGWDGVDVASFFRPEFACPVHVDNDVNVMALGEQWAGASRAVANSVVVKVGTGIGAGIISDGRIHRGADGCAGDLGHIEVDPDGPVCHCGNRGCIEAIAGGAAIGRLALRAAEDGSSPFLAERLSTTGSLTARDVAEAAQHGDQAALEIIRSSGRLIGRVLAGTVNLFNPSLIVVSGGVCGLGHLFLSGIREVVYRRSTALSARRLEIRFSDIPDTAGVIGAAILSIEELFASGGVGLANNDGAAEPAHRRRNATKRLVSAGTRRGRTLS
jgi:glucokinase-like ROK family protein